jgi:hypothetical protein
LKKSNAKLRSRQRMVILIPSGLRSACLETTQ